MLYKDLAMRDEFSDLDLYNPDSILAKICEFKLFRVESPSLVKEIIAFNIKANQIGYIFPETYNLVNHIRGVTCIAHKTRLAETMTKYAKNRKLDPESIIPKTFLLRLSSFEVDLERLLSSKKKDDNFLEPVIVKPGENSNRGNGIAMAYSAEEV